MVEVDDPKICLMFHMMTTLEPIDPVLESPLSDPMARQTAAACSLLTEIAATKVASEGMLLANLEKDGNVIYKIKIVKIQKPKLLEHYSSLTRSYLKSYKSLGILILSNNKGTDLSFKSS